ncbi:hypothetical protein [Singulisphaera acidiphila]|nr:hypothetical protein [Singulisphaera acidiphila]
MPNRKSLVSTFLITSLLALLAGILVGPIRTPGFATVSSRPDCLCHNLALPTGQPKACLRAVIATDVVLQMNACPSKNEKQDRADALDKAPENEEQEWADVRDEPRIFFLLPGSFRKVPDRQLIAPPSIFSLCPLRC